MEWIRGKNNVTREEIAKLENCTFQTVSESIELVRKKIKKYFS